MKKNVISIFAISGLLSLGTIAHSASVTINDMYNGGSDWTPYGGPIVAEPDLIGSASSYEVSRMDVTIETSFVRVDIYSRWFDNIGVDDTEIGDFFISTDDWTPFGSAADRYNTDVAANGEDWEYALVFDTRDGSTTSGSLSLYSVDAPIITAGPAYTPTGYRLGQEILYDTSGDTAESGFRGGWRIFGLGTADDQDDYMTLFFDNSSLGLDIDEFAMRFSMTCANDIIEGGSEVPEPATLLLFGAGMAGFAGRRLSRKKK